MHSGYSAITKHMQNIVSPHAHQLTCAYKIIPRSYERCVLNADLRRQWTSVDAIYQYCDFIQYLLKYIGIKTMTIEEQMLAAFRAMDDRSKLLILRLAVAQAVDCPAAPAKTLRLAASDLSCRPLVDLRRHPKNVQLSVVRGPAK